MYVGMKFNLSFFSLFLLLGFIPFQANSQTIHKDLTKAIKFYQEQKNEKARSLVQKHKESEDNYNQLLARLLEVRWSGREKATEQIAKIRGRNLYSDVEKVNPTDSLIGFYWLTMAEHFERNMKNPENASSLFDRAMKNYKISYSDNPKALARKYKDQGDFYRIAKKNNNAVEAYSRTDSIYQKHNFTRDLLLADCYQQVHRCLGFDQKYSKSIAWFDKALDLFQQLSLYDHQVRLYFNQASNYFDQGSFEKSVEAFEQARKLILAHNATKYVPIALIHQRVSGIHAYKFKDYPKAIDVAKSGLPLIPNDGKTYWTEYYLNYLIAYSFKFLRQADSALVYAQNAFRLETTIVKDTCKLGNAYQDLGVFKRDAGDIKGSLEAFEKLANLVANCGASKSEQLTNFQKLGVEYMNQLSDSRKAEHYWNKTHAIWKELQMPENKEYAVLLLDLGNAHANNGNGEMAKNMLKRSIELFRKYADKNMEYRARKDLGSTYLDLEQLDSAYEVLSRGLKEGTAKNIDRQYVGLFNIHLAEYFEKVRDLDNAMRHYRVADSYFSGLQKAKTYDRIASIHFQNDLYDSALFYYDQYESLLIRERQFSPNSQMLLFGNKGKILKNQGKLSEATDLFEKAVSIYEENFGVDAFWAMSSYISLIECYQSMGQAEKYNAVLEKLEPLLPEPGGLRDRNYVRIFNSLGSHYFASDPTKSVAYIQQAFYHNSLTFSAQDSLNNPTATEFINPDDFLSTARRKAAALSKIADQADSVYRKEGGYLAELMAARIDNYLGKDNTAIYELALDTYALCDTIINYTRELYSTDEAKQELSSQATEIFELAIFSAYAAHTRTGDLKFLERAYQFMAQNKARTLLESVERTQAKKFSGVSQEWINKEQQLQESVTQLGILYGSTKDPSIKAKYDEARIKLNTLHRELRSSNSRYASLRSSDNIATARGIQNSLMDNTGYIEYFVTMEQAGAIIATMTRDKLDFHFVNFDFPLDRRIRGFRNAMLTKLDGPTKTFGKDLYKALIDPVKEHVGNKDKWIIVPDNMLGYVPFEAFMDENDQYLIGTKEISYSYSGTLFSKNKPGHPEVKSVLAFAPVFENEETNLLVATKERAITKFNAELEPSRTFLRDGGRISTLPGTAKEVEQIDALYKSKGANSDFFMHKDANEEQIKNMDLTRYSYLHFATHGIVDESNPQLSGLIMSQDATSQEDCILYSGEVFNLELDAELVTLSACETGLGKVVKGEGIIGLSRAFLYAGTENVQVSLWKVSDASTSQLMVDFYEDVMDGQSNATALRNAKLKLLNEDRFKAPYYWAPFILIGQ